MSAKHEEALNHLAKFLVCMVADQLELSGDSNWPASMKEKTACKYLEVGRTKFWELVGDGFIPQPYESGGTNRWDRKDLDRYLQEKKRETQRRQE